MKIKRGLRRAPVSLPKLILLSMITLVILTLAGCSAGAGSGNGGNGGNNITVAITNKVASVQAGTAAITFNATVQNDSSNSGVTWSLTANGASCSPTCGALSAATAASVTYTPPASAGASPNNQPTLTATSVAKTSKSDSDTFTVNAALSVTITNKSNFTAVNTGTRPFVVNATVQNDSTNSGVTWTLTTNGAACTAACGTLTGTTTSSTTYNPPSAAHSNVTLTATSVRDNSKSDFTSFSISTAPISVTIGNKVGTVYAGGNQIFFEANVQNDPTNSPVTWTLTANGTSCSPACGTIPNPNPGSQSVLYTSPASVPASPNNHPTLTAVSSADGTKSDFDSFTIAALPSVSVKLTKITSVLAGGAGVSISANIQYDPSTTPTVNWTLTANGSACSPSCGSLSGTAPASVTYKPPATVPASPNNQPTITATSTYNGTSSDSETFSVISTVANSCGAAGGHESLLNGHYALLLQGYTGSAGATPFALAASFVADGTGKITGGEEDVNDTISPQNLTFTSNGSLYTVGADNRGCLQLTNAGGATSVFRFALGGVSADNASKGRIIEFDYNSGSGAGSLTSGILRRQDTSAFTLGALASTYAFGVDGWTENDNQLVHLVTAGSFSNNNGTLSGVYDENDAGVVFPEAGVSGSSNTIGSVSATSGRAVVAFDVFNWAMYVINSSECFLVSTDPLNINALTSGRAIAAPNSFTASTVSGNYIMHSSGNTSSKASVALELLTMTPGGAQAGTLSGTAYSYGGGNAAQTTNLSNVAYNVDPSSGRVTLGNPGDNLPILYLATPADGISAFIAGVNADAQEGVIEFQPSQTYSTASVAGTFTSGTEDPGDNTVYDEVGTLTVSNTGSASGTVDSSTTAGLAPGAPFNTILTINSDGTGSVALNSSTAPAITNGTKIFYMDESAGVIVVAEQ